MTTPRLDSVLCASPRGLHRVGFAEWGEPDNPRVAVCVHGLTRSGRDFDRLARELSRTHRVFCPDMAGRGRSDRLADPMLYGVPQYVADCVTLVARTGAQSVDWVGTSMGGLIGMALASLPGNPVARLVLNDIGPELSKTGLERIAAYTGQPAGFATREEGLAWLRDLAAGFGPHTDDAWSELNAHYFVERDDGRWTYHYDPAIAVPFRNGGAVPAPDMWPMWNAIRCPVLAVRGAESDLLPPAVFARMQAEGPKARGIEFAGVGHAPTFMTGEQIAPVIDFLSQPS